MSSSKAAESSTPISGGSLGGVGTAINKPMKDETDDSSPFQEGEHVLAFHGPLLYDAKVQKAESHMDGWRYYVHYRVSTVSYISSAGMFSWDEWLGVNLLLKHTEENVQKQKELEEKHAAEKNVKPGRLSQDKTKSSVAECERLHFDSPEAEEELVAGYQTEYSGGRGKKRKDEMVPKEECIVPSEMLVSIQIPSTLKKQLVDDHECITQLGQLVKLPRSPSVYEILNKYFDYRVKKDGMIVETVGEIVNGLRCYFDKALPAMLLYKHERQQYKEAITDNISPSSVYGAEHLLRLFVKLPEMLSCMRIEKETLTELQLKLVDLLRFLQSNQSAFFQSNYQKYEGFLAAIKEEDD